MESDSHSQNNQSAVQRFLSRFSLTQKMLMLTVAVGVLAGVVLDGVQSRKLREIFYAQQSERLQREAREARIRFDNYVAAFNQTARLLASHAAFRDYIAQRPWARTGAPATRRYDEIPPWMPEASVLRKLVHIHFALLVDESGVVREIYQDDPDPAPKDLLTDRLLRQLSNRQSYMTNIDGAAFIVTSESVVASPSGRTVTLMLASPVEDDFLTESQGGATGQDLIALVSRDGRVVLASNHPAVLAPGTRLDEAQDRFIITGKSFFDGASDLVLQFTSLISKNEYEKLSRSILSRDRQQRIWTVFVLIAVFAVVTCWITRRIRLLTKDVVDFSRDALGASAKELNGGDALHVLRERFRSLTREVVSSRNSLLREKTLLQESNLKLEQANREIDVSRGKLQHALDETSALIQKVANEKSFHVRFSNPGLKKCHEVMACRNTECSCYGADAARCWQIAGTYCLDRPQGSFVEKYGDCSECPVYRDAVSDPIYMIGEHFNNMMHILESQHQELEKAYADLTAAQSQLFQQEKMASIGQLAAGVAHEINNPMGFIISNLGALDRYVARFKEFIEAQSAVVNAPGGAARTRDLGELRQRLKIDHIMEDADQLLRESREGAERVKTIVQNLKSFSRVDEAGQKPGDINAGLESTLAIVWNELKYKAAVTKEYGELPQTTCNIGQLNQVFMNLLVNAGQAIKDRGTIAVRTWCEDGSIFVSVSDTGCGIPEELGRKIFEPFFTTKDVGQGTGLGLSISYDIVKKHNGEITVSSKAGGGTTFTVRIPVA